MSKLSGIKERAGSVEKIKKITGALEVVALTRLRRQQKNTINARPYSQKLREMVFDISGKVAQREHPLLQSTVIPVPAKAGKAGIHKIRNVNIILITSDKGLCGGFNNNLITKADDFYNKKRHLTLKFIAIGKKGYNFFTSRGAEIKDYIFNLNRNDEILRMDIYRLADKLIEEFLAGELDEVHIIHSNFKLQLLGEVKILKLLPIKLENNPGIGVKRDYIYEPASFEVFDMLLREYLRNQILHAVIESKTSEEMARMVAMKQATDSADELIKNLMLNFHKERQRAITRELIDIVNAT